MITDKSYSIHTHTCPSVRPSFQAVLEDVKRQVDYDCFGEMHSGYTDGRIEEICKIIAEVQMLNPEGETEIAGEHLPVYMVQEVFRGLRFEHVELVSANYARITSLVHRKKAYIRTALYNSFFELGAHYTNQVKHDLGM